MDLKVSKIILHTKNKVRLIGFLSFIFDTDVNIEDESLFIGNVQILLDEKVKPLKYSGFWFKLESLDDLNDLRNKVELAYYKEGIEYKDNSKINNDGEFVFKDLDGNTWSFAL